jgi:signal transduction histidine kinase
MASTEKISTLSWIYDLYKLGHLIGSSNGEHELYQEILLHVVSGLDGCSGSLALCEADRKTLTIVAGVELPAGVIGKMVNMGEGVLGTVAQSGKAVLLNGSISNDTRFPHKVDRTETVTPKSAICWPLMLEKSVIGAVSVNRSDGQLAFSQDDLERGTVILNLVSVVLSNINLYAEQQQRLADLQEAKQRIEDTQHQLLQSEKMASIGQLAAGVAHEINNPIGFVNSNLSTLGKYLDDMLRLLKSYEALEACVDNQSESYANLQSLKRQVDLPFLREDIPSLMNESRDGIERIKSIVQALKDFSHTDTGEEWKWADIHHCLESTINIGWHELKYKAEVVKQFGDLPEVECLPSQLNQVFLNMLVNAGHAIRERGVITIRTEAKNDHVIVEFKDNGCGIPPENLKRIFDPFFTTKKVGQGTGLGLALSYGIIQKHNGQIDVESESGVGTVFRIVLPLRHIEDSAVEEAKT